MIYSEGEIVAMYREAADKAAQIEILADLNGCKICEIEDVLVRAGHSVPMRTRKPSTTTSRWTDEEVEKLRRYVEEGLSNLEIAERMGLSKTAIAYQISTRGFTELRGQKKSAEHKENKNPDIDTVYIKQLETQVEDLTKRLKCEQEKVCKLGTENVMLSEELNCKEKACEELRAELCSCWSKEDSPSSGGTLKNIKGLAHLVLCGLRTLQSKQTQFEDSILDGAITGVASIICLTDEEIK